MKVKQKILEYPAMFTPAEEGGYNVSFPDFPGCVTFGGTFEEAKEYAMEVLELWIEQLSADNQPIPAPPIHPIITEVAVRVPARS